MRKSGLPKKYSLQAFPAMIKDACLLLESQMLLVHKEKRHFFFKGDECKAKVECFQVSLNRCSGEGTHVSKSPNNKCLRLKVLSEGAVNHVEDEVGNFLQSVFHWMKNSVCQHISRTGAFVKRHNVTIMEILLTRGTGYIKSYTVTQLLRMAILALAAISVP